MSTLAAATDAPSSPRSPLTSDPLRRRFLVFSAVGGAAWLLALALIGDDVVAALLALATLVLVPLALSVVFRPDRTGMYPRSARWVAILGLPAAMALTLALSLDPGPIAGWWAVPWAGTTVLIGLVGLRRLIARGVRWIDETAIDVGCGFLAVGGVWTLITASGTRPMDFSSQEVLLAAVHFHYAGFVLAVLGATVCRAGAGRFARLALGGALLGVPSVALGIAFSSVLEWLGAVLLVTSGLAIAAEQLATAFRRRPTAQRVLLSASAAALFVGMALAAIHAVLSTRLSVDLMTWIHGASNAVGFALLGLLGWAIDPPEPSLAGEGIPFSPVAARWRVGPDFFERDGAVDRRRQVRGLTDSLDVFRRADFATERVHPAVRAFYEDTANHDIEVFPRWTPGFRFLYRVFRLVAGGIGQVDFPLLGEAPSSIDNAVVALVGDRPGLRAWIRTYVESPGRAMYVAEYSTHLFGDVTYMDIAFPYPGGNLASILRPNPIDFGAPHLGFQLTTLDGDARGDAGIWFATRHGPIRLPLQETIDVWAPDMEGVPESLKHPPKGTTVVARHELRMFGVRYLLLDYLIEPNRS